MRITVLNAKLPFVSINVISWNRKNKLTETLMSLKKINYPSNNLEILVIDNGSIDGSQQIVKEEFPSIRLIDFKENQGVAKATNEGIKRSKGSYIFRLDNDVIVDRNCLLRLVNIMQLDHKIGIVGAFPVIFDYKQVFFGMPFERRFVSQLASCSMLIRKEMVDKIGYFDETFSLYCWEDTELCWRANLLEYKVILDYEAFVFHHIGQTSKQGSIAFEKNYFKNGLYTHLKLSNWLNTLVFLFNNTFHLLTLAMIIRHPFQNSYLVKKTIDAWVFNIIHFKETFRKRTEIKKLQKISNRQLNQLIKNTKIFTERDKKYIKNEFN